MVPTSAVGVIEPRLADLAVHDGQLMAQDQDLDVFVIGGTETKHEQVKGATGSPVEEAKRHHQPAG